MVTGICEGNSLVTCEFPAQMATNTENFPFDDVIMNTLIIWIYVQVSHISVQVWTKFPRKQI